MQRSVESGFRVVTSRDELSDQTGGASDDEAFVIEESMGYLVNYLARAFVRALAERLAKHGATLGQWSVLMFLWAEDGQSQRELSRRVAVEDATMVRTIDRMERDGIVRRVRDTHDRRRVNVFLTEKGMALRDPLVSCAVDGNEAVTRPFTEAEKRQLGDLLRRMIGALESDHSTRKKGSDRVQTEGVE